MVSLEKYNVQVLHFRDGNVLVADYKNNVRKTVKIVKCHASDGTYYEGTEVGGSGAFVGVSSKCKCVADVVRLMYGNVNMVRTWTGKQIYGVLPCQCIGFKKPLFNVSELSGGDLCIECLVYPELGTRRFVRLLRYMDWGVCDDNPSKVFFGWYYMPFINAWDLSLQTTDEHVSVHVNFYRNGIHIPALGYKSGYSTFMEVCFGNG